jgi:hypothetical protein
VCTESLSSGVVVVKSAQNGARTDRTGSLNWARNRRILVQRSVRSDAIVIVDVGFQDPTQMHLAQAMMWSTHSRRIDPISRSAKPFCQGEAGAAGLSRMPMARNRRDDAAIDPVAIVDQVVRSLIPGKSLRDLTCNPFSRGICCDVR